MLRLVSLVGVALVVVACPEQAPITGPTTSTTVTLTTDSSPSEVIDATETSVATGHIEIESMRLPGRLWDPFLPPLADGTSVTIDGWLTTPPMATSTDPVPAVIIVHGCGGPGSSERDWATELLDQGFAIMLIDSFGARGVGEVCSGRETLNVADLIVDVYRSADLLRDDPRVDGDRIAVLGFSFGGRTALWSALTRFQETYGGSPLRAYAAFYPSTCFIRLEADTDVAGGPIAIFHGTADDWTPIEPCQEFVDRLGSDGVDATMFAYPGAHHGFDGRWLAWGGLHLSPGVPSPRNCSFVESDGAIIDPETGGVAGVGSPCVEVGVHYAYDADAREAATVDLLDFLEAAFA